MNKGKFRFTEDTENIIETSNLKKEIVEILADYKYNATKTETTEQFADKIIEQALSSQRDKFEKEKSKWFEERGRMAKLLFDKGVTK